MRCPKCGYISFDALTNCGRCKKNIESASELVQGSVYDVVPPSFLHIQSLGAEEESAVLRESELENTLEEADQEVDDVDIFEGTEETAPVDDVDDTEIYADDFEEVAEEGNASEDENFLEGDIEVDAEHYKISSLAKEEAAVDEVFEVEEDVQQLPDMPMPEELEDMSDLQAPAAYARPDDTSGEEERLDLQRDDADSTIELEDLDLGFDIGDLDLGAEKNLEPIQEGEISLDELDFSGDDASDNTADGFIDDLDLDLDLDLDISDNP